MRKAIFLAVTLAAYPAVGRAEEISTSPEPTVVSYELPQACKDAPASMDMSKSDRQMKKMSGMDDTQLASMDSMAKMQAAMMQAAMIKDPDIAFNCGMIVHHQGGIAMSIVELKTGKDETSRETARKIIAAQSEEIKAMTSRVTALAAR